jgi:hypothetical protein
MGLQALRIIASVLLAAGALLLCGALAHAYTADIEVGDITINEVMWGPVGNDNYREWFEVKNMAGRDLDLGGCTVTDNSGTFTITELTTITAGAYFLFCLRTSTTASEVPGCDYQYYYADDVRLANGGDSITITCGITVVDAISFESGWPAGGSNGPAMAFNLRSGDMPSEAGTLNDQPDRWCSATSVFTYTDDTTTDLGTPGGKDDVCTGWTPNAIALSHVGARPGSSWYVALLSIGVLIIGATLWVARQR